MDVYERSATPSRGNATNDKAASPAPMASRLPKVVSLLMRSARGEAGEMRARTEVEEGGIALERNAWAAPRQANRTAILGILQGLESGHEPQS